MRTLQKFLVLRQKILAIRGSTRRPFPLVPLTLTIDNKLFIDHRLVLPYGYSVPPGIGSIVPEAFGTKVKDLGVAGFEPPTFHLAAADSNH